MLQRKRMKIVTFLPLAIRKCCFVCYWLTASFSRIFFYHTQLNTLSQKQGDFREQEVPQRDNFPVIRGMMTNFLELLRNFLYRGLPPLYFRKSARFFGQCRNSCSAGIYFIWEFSQPLSNSLLRIAQRLSNNLWVF